MFSQALKSIIIYTLLMLLAFPSATFASEEFDRQIIKIAGLYQKALDIDKIMLSGGMLSVERIEEIFSEALAISPEAIQKINSTDHPDAQSKVRAVIDILSRAFLLVDTKILYRIVKLEQRNQARVPSLLFWVLASSIQILPRSVDFLLAWADIEDEASRGQHLVVFQAMSFFLLQQENAAMHAINLLNSTKNRRTFGVGEWERIAVIANQVNAPVFNLDVALAMSIHDLIYTYEETADPAFELTAKILALYQGLVGNTAYIENPTSLSALRRAEEFLKKRGIDLQRHEPVRLKALVPKLLCIRVW